MDILPDSNFLIYIVKYKIIDEFLDLRANLIMPSTVLDEMKKLAVKAKGDDKKNAKLALMLIEKCRREKKASIIKSVGYTDEAILKIARQKKKLFVATLDRTLIKKLKKVKIGIIKIRQKKYLIFD